MKLHEYQAKDLFRNAGLPVPVGIPCFTVDDAVTAAQSMNVSQWIVKAQIHAGGRGKGGGVCFASSIDDVQELAQQMLGMRLVTHQTGPDGRLVEKLLVEEAIEIVDELYIGMVVDRNTQKVSLIASREGGTEIESIAKNSPEKVYTFQIDSVIGVDSQLTDSFVEQLKLPNALYDAFHNVLQGIYDLFIDIDATLLEINPLGLMADGAICVADAKVTIDDSAMYRQPNIAAMRDVAEENPGEVAASDVGLNYISLDGNIGCLVNGAGLAMATMDIIKLYGGSPANFLDIGGGATVSQVSAAFSIMLGQDAVEVILVNIFGGIMQCDVIAAGIVEAVQNVGLKLPLIIRLEGTNVEEGREIFVASGIQFTSANTMDDAARLASAAIQG